MNSIDRFETAAARGRSLDQRFGAGQAIAGSLFALFVLAHLANVLLALLGPDAFDTVQRMLRAVYQHPLVETVVVFGALVAHLTASLVRWYLHRGRGKRPWRMRLHTWAGVFLAVVIFGHILAVRGPSMFFDVYPGFEGIAFSMWLAPLYFYPYYFLLGLAGFYHATNGVLTVAARRGLRSRSARRIQVAATTVFAVALMLALAAFGTGDEDSTDNDFARLYAEVLGISLP